MKSTNARTLGAARRLDVQDPELRFYTRYGVPLNQLAAGWLTYDMRLMMAGIQQFGMQAAEGTVERLQAIIGHPLRTYEDFVREALAKV